MKQQVSLLVCAFVMFTIGHGNSYAVSAPAQPAAGVATQEASTTSQIQMLNNQLQKQLQQLQATQQKQVMDMNKQIQSQMKQMQTTLQAQINKVNTQSQAQMKKMLTDLQAQIKQVQQDATKKQ